MARGAGYEVGRGDDSRPEKHICVVWPAVPAGVRQWAQFTSEMFQLYQVVNGAGTRMINHGDRQWVAPWGACGSTAQGWRRVTEHWKGWTSSTSSRIHTAEGRSCACDFSTHTCDATTARCHRTVTCHAYNLDIWCWAHTNNAQVIKEFARECEEDRVWNCFTSECIAKGQCGCYSIQENQQENIMPYREFVVLGSVRITAASLRVVHSDEG